MSHSRQSTLDLVESTGVVAIIRLKDASQVSDIVGALKEGGVRAMEITMSVPGAVNLIRQIAPTLPADFKLGAGTVTDGQTAAACIDAGAAFIVSPVLRRDVLDMCRARNVPSMPGCFSPTEILDAWDAGADIVKVFPATSLGPGYLKDLRGPLPQLKLMPTGGVSVENAHEWIRAGAVAVGVGSALTDPAAIAARDYASITAKARHLVDSVAAAKGAK
jgi:2-dehydro-3-deoxyphosphogluconate aldolase / (4S)-4-hydroxy-2-oxoglutarate aldolase